MRETDADVFAPLVDKLQRLKALADVDRDAILGLPYTVRSVDPRGYIVREGRKISHCHVLLTGYGCRHKIVGSGGRQIVSFHLPGDFLDLQNLHLDTADHNVGSITRTTVASIPVDELRQLTAQNPAIAQALWSDTLIDGSMAREWIANVGRRNAAERVAHLLCEFVARCEAAGIATPAGFTLPMTQDEIADATGLTPVHVNRVLRALEKEGLIARQIRDFRIAEWDRLREFADFSSRYLHQMV